MPTPPILEVETFDWTYEGVAEELEHLAMLENLEPPAGPMLSELPGILLDDEITRVAADLERLAELEGR
jgi:hypothetical protein